MHLFDGPVFPVGRASVNIHSGARVILFEMIRGTLLVLGLATGCASAPEAPKSRPHRATFVNDLFQVEQGMPVREPANSMPFFHKQCELVGRRPHWTRSEYECSETPY